MINAVWYTNTSVKIVFVLGTAMIDPACGIFGRYQVDQMPVAQLVSDPTLHQMDASDQKDIKHRGAAQVCCQKECVSVVSLGA